MSGGSWDYLYDSFDHCGGGPDPAKLRKAAERLTELGDAASAKVALEVATHLEQAQQLFETHLGGYLGPLWHMEWVDSGDYLEKQFAEALAKGWSRVKWES